MRIKTKLILLFMAVSLSPLAVGFVASYFQLKKNTEIITKQQLQYIAELTSHSTFLYEEKMIARTQDWASDAHMRSLVSNINTLLEKGEVEAARQEGLVLGEYMTNAKLKMDSTAVIIDIISLDAEMISSTNRERIGHRESPNELQHEYAWLDAKNGSYGQVFVAGLTVMEEDEPGHVGTGPTAHYSTPLIDVNNGGTIGVLTVHFIVHQNMNSLTQSIISSDENVGQSIRNLQTLDVFLVNRNGYLVTDSRFIKDAILEQKIDTDAVRACNDVGVNFSGIYKNHRDATVIGYTTCPQGAWWMVIVEIEEQDAISIINTLKNNMLSIATLMAFYSVLVGWLISLSLGGRIGRLSSGIVEIAKGNFNVSVRDESNDELSIVSKGINSMAEKLKELFDVVNTQKTKLNEQVGLLQKEDLERKLMIDIPRKIEDETQQEQAYSNILSLFGETIGWRLGSVWFPSKDKSHLELLYSWGIKTEADKEFLKISKEKQFQFIPGQGLPGRVWAMKKPSWILDVTVDSNYPRAPYAKKAGIHTGMAFPVVINNEVIAVFEYYVSEVKVEDNWLMDLATRAGIQAAIALENKIAKQKNGAIK